LYQNINTHDIAGNKLSNILSGPPQELLDDSTSTEPTDEELSHTPKKKKKKRSREQDLSPRDPLLSSPSHIKSILGHIILQHSTKSGPKHHHLP
jgi:hypothetical protein